MIEEFLIPRYLIQLYFMSFVLTRSPEYSMYSNLTIFYALFIWYRLHRLYVDGDGQGRTSISRRPTFLVEGFEDTESFPAGLQYTLVRVNFVNFYRYRAQY